jgi:hypothetical protein
MRLGWESRTDFRSGLSFEWHMRRIIILGGPRVGKTTLSQRLKETLGIQTLHASDDIKHLEWSESSAEAAKWFDESGSWIVEGVQMARALRKWLLANANKPFDADVISLDKPYEELSTGQQSMTAGVQTVLGDIEAELLRRGARIHKLKDPEDAINILHPSPEESGNSRRQKSVLKSIYQTYDEIPEGDRPHYKKLGGRYVLELDGEHPVQAQVTTITEEKRTELAKANQRAATAEAEAQRLKTQAESQPTLPSGHVPVPADKAKLLDSIEELGEGADLKAKVEDIKTKVTAHKDLSTKVATLEKTDLLRRVADTGIAGKKLKPSVLQTLDSQAGGLTYEERDVSVTENGKTETKKVWHVKDNNKWVPFQEYSDTHWKDFGPALLAEETNGGGGTKVIGQVPDDKSKGGGNIYDDIRKQAAEANKQQIESIPLEKRLHMA